MEGMKLLEPKIAVTVDVLLSSVYVDCLPKFTYRVSQIELQYLSLIRNSFFLTARKMTIGCVRASQ